MRTLVGDVRDLVILGLLLAVVLLGILVLTQLHLDDEPYPCVPVGREIAT